MSQFDPDRGRRSDFAPLQSLNRLSNSSESSNIILRVIEFLSLPKESGDVVVLLLVHPGLNLLGRYFPPSKVNSLLLGEYTPRSRPSPFQDEMFSIGLDSPQDFEGEMEVFDVMDLASFLEYVALSRSVCCSTFTLTG